jgi:hypothetical protein
MKILMRHKIIQVLLCFLFAATISSGCKKVLDLEDTSHYPANGIFDDEATANAYLSNLYARTFSGGAAEYGKQCR